jgi:acyl-coenzyme A synthetase/AMP-(fatty) acid ligase
MEGIELHPWEENFKLPERFNMVSLLLERHLEQGRGQRVAIYYEGEKITYEQLGELTNRVGNALGGLGVEPEQRVFLMLPDGPEFVAAFLGTMKIGAVPVPINLLATPSDLAYFLNDSRAKAVVVGQEFLPKIEAVRGDCRSLRYVIVAGDEPGRNLSFRDLIGKSSPKLEVFPTHKDDSSYWLYSSGTTGQPKGVIHLHHDLYLLRAPAFLFVRSQQRPLSSPLLWRRSRAFTPASGAACGAGKHPALPSDDILFRPYFVRTDPARDRGQRH